MLKKVKEIKEALVKETKAEDVLVDAKTEEALANAKVEEAPAVFGVDGEEKKATKKKAVKKTAKKAPKKAKEKKVETPKIEPKKENKPKDKPTKKEIKIKPRNTVLNAVGIKSDEILEEEKREITRAQKNEEFWEKIQNHIRRGDILCGKVFGINKNRDNSKLDIEVIWNGEVIHIPEGNYFMPTFDFGRKFAKFNEAKKLHRKEILARYQINANVCFKIKSANRVKFTDEEFKKYGIKYKNTIIGDRVAAMNDLQDWWFFHSKPGVKYPKIPEVGNITKANVISVNPERILVECLGVETRIDAFNLSNENIENCLDFTKPGARIDVKLRRVYVEKGKVYLSVSGRIKDTTKIMTQLAVGGTYKGVIQHYNKEKRLYTATLINGVTVTIKADNVQGYSKLMRGDDVAVYISVITEDGYALGKAIKL